MIIVLAGRRVDALDAEQPRFPLANVNGVEQRLRDLMATIAPRVVVCSAACGADLLALKAARDLGIRYRIVLPFDRERFRSTSVIDRPGEWGTLFDALYEVAQTRHDVMTVPPSADDTAAYTAANEQIFAEALALTGKETGWGGTDLLEESLMAVVVWDGHPRGENDLTADFAARARAIRARVVEVNTLFPVG